MPRTRIIIVFLGDVLVFYAALTISVFIRSFFPGDAAPLPSHLFPFTILFAIWIIVYYIASLYERHAVVLKSRLPALILNIQAINSLIGVLFFYLIPSFGLTPKTILFVDLVVTIVLMILWRVIIIPRMGLGVKERALIIGADAESRDLYRAVNESDLYPLRFVAYIDLERLSGDALHREITGQIANGATTVVADLSDVRIAPLLPSFYMQLSRGVRFAERHKIYEDIFDKIPLSKIGYAWFLSNVSGRTHAGYDLAKRVMDIIVSLALFIPTVMAMMFVALAIKLDDGGPLFYVTERVGKSGKSVFIIKFRSMTGRDKGNEALKTKHSITRVGHVLRRTRIDELPQLWNVFCGDLSLIGPRPEIPALVDTYRAAIPFYDLRHLVTPGLSGWAQVHHEEHPHHGVAVRETAEKLSYDLYYIKNRSLALDLKIALKTVRTLLARAGR